MTTLDDDLIARLGQLNYIEFSRELNPELQTFERWLEQYGKEIPIAA